jgi:hypothetical protein
MFKKGAYRISHAKHPMSCREIYDACVNKGLWATQSGKTPANTLYSAILREIGNKGSDARFVKVERGRFQSS